MMITILDNQGKELHLHQVGWKKNLQDLLKRWSAELVNDLRVLPDRAVTEINKVRKHVRLGCLSAYLIKRDCKWLKKDQIGVALTVALLTTGFYKLSVCHVKQKGREHRICKFVSHWFLAFLASR